MRSQLGDGPAAARLGLPLRNALGCLRGSLSLQQGRLLGSQPSLVPRLGLGSAAPSLGSRFRRGRFARRTLGLPCPSRCVAALGENPIFVNGIWA